MSGTEETFHMTKEDVRKLESKDSKLHGGKIPADSDVAGLQSIVDSKVKLPDVIEERKANLPLPEDPPAAPDFNSADARTVNVGSGGVEEDITYGNAGASGLRQPTTAESSARVDGEEWKVHTAPDANVGRQGHDHLDSLPADAVTREARHKVKKDD